MIGAATAEALGAVQTLDAPLSALFGPMGELDPSKAVPVRTM